MSEAVTAIDTNQLGDEGVHTVRVLVSDYYDETEELELEISRHGVSFNFYFEGTLDSTHFLSHQDLFMLFAEDKIDVLTS